jgi:glycine cleavage system H protein
MSEGNIPNDRRYTKSHEWVLTSDHEVTVGITDHAQSELTDIVFVDLPKVGAAVQAGRAVLVLESVKTVADVYAPVDGTVAAVNTDLKSHPELINQDPYGKGWLVRLTASGSVDPSRLLDAEGYRASLSAA